MSEACEHNNISTWISNLRFILFILYLRDFQEELRSYGRKIVIKRRKREA
jgi:hypothetical protein